MQCNLKECKNEIVGRQKTAKYCSKRCSSLASYRRSGRAWRQTRQQKNKLLKGQTNCHVCNAPLKGKQRTYCSVACKTKKHSSYPTQKKRGLRRKLRLIELMGGCCQSDTCPVGGRYASNIAGLVFHHKDPSTKSFSLDMRRISNRTWDAVLDEAEKCILLCQLCHMELHYPDMEKALLDAELLG